MCPRVAMFQGLVTGYDELYVNYLNENNEEGEIALPTYPEGLAGKLKLAFDQSVENGTNISIACCSAMGTS